MTLIYERDLYILQMYLRAKNEVLSQCFQKLEPEQGRQKDRQTGRCDWTFYHAVFACCNKFVHTLVRAFLNQFAKCRASHFYIGRATYWVQLRDRFGGSGLTNSETFDIFNPLFGAFDSYVRVIYGHAHRVRIQLTVRIKWMRPRSLSFF